MQTVEIDNLNLPGLQPYKTLRRPADHHRVGIFVAEGEKVVRRLLESRMEIVSILLTPEWLEKLQERPELSSRETLVYVAPKHIMETIVGFHLHQGIMAVGRIPPPVGLFDLLPGLAKPYLLVAVDGLTNAENLGVFVRNSVAFGVQVLIVGETSSSPYLRRAVRNSMGAIFTLPVASVENLSQTLRDLHGSYAIETIAAHPHSKQAILSDVDFRHSCCIVFGSEGEGISQQVLEACTKRASIPMRNGVDSLNVAVANAVVLYEVARQRG